ncbi:MAG: HipA domain-containing protein [Burkholderiaceae bacterium]
MRYLRGKGTSLGGMRPKCTMVDEDGWLAIGKFPSVGDTRSVTPREVLALKLAVQAGTGGRWRGSVRGHDVPVAVIRAASMPTAPTDGFRTNRPPHCFKASREEDRSYTEIADAIHTRGHAPTPGVRQLWRRLVFNLLITNVDDHLQNHGFLPRGTRAVAFGPAFDINPFPDKERESKTWLSEQDGPITDDADVAGARRTSRWTKVEALAVLADVHAAVKIDLTVAAVQRSDWNRRDWTISRPRSSTGRRRRPPLAAEVVGGISLTVDST